jgi:hypothetical protein
MIPKEEEAAKYISSKENREATSTTWPQILP